MTVTETAKRSSLDLERPRPRARRLKILVGSIVVGFATYSIAYVANYQPLVRGHWGSVGDDCFRDLGTFHPFGGEPFDVWALDCSRRGDKVAWYGSIANAGRFPVTVTGFPITDKPSWDPLGPIEAWAAPLTNEIPPPLEPFRPFTLRPGEEYWIEFRSALRRDCEPNAGATIFAFELVFKVGPIVRHDHLTALPQLRLDCPGARS